VSFYANKPLVKKFIKRWASNHQLRNINEPLCLLNPGSNVIHDAPQKNMSSPDKQKKLEERMETLGIREDDIEEQFIRGSGHGGQKINTSSNCVLLKHIPTGLQVRCQAERGLQLNRYRARSRLADKIEAQILGKESAEEQKREKIRRQKRKRSKRAKEKILKEKHQRSERLSDRQVPNEK
jgi:peptide chain release factor